MKTVFTKSELAHVWFRRSQECGRTSSHNFYFTGDTIYSYGSHFPIARFDDDVILFTTREYSVTTSSQKNEVRSAIPSSHTVFNVDNVNASNKPAHRANLDHIEEEIKVLLDKSTRARTNKDCLIADAIRRTIEANEYSKHYKLRKRLPEITEEYAGNIASIMKADKVKKRRAAALAEKKRLAENQDKLNAWLKGGNVRLPRFDKCYMRVVGDVIQTSQGVDFPVEHAKLAWRVVESCRSRKETFKTNGRTIKLGHYNIDYIDTKGNVKAGCHYVEFDQIERCAKYLDLVKEEVAA